MIGDVSQPSTSGPSQSSTSGPSRTFSSRPYPPSTLGPYRSSTAGPSQSSTSKLSISNLIEPTIDANPPTLPSVPRDEMCCICNKIFGDTHKPSEQKCGHNAGLGCTSNRESSSTLGPNKCLRCKEGTQKNRKTARPLQPYGAETQMSFGSSRNLP
jgi:hypothetical protein